MGFLTANFYKTDDDQFIIFRNNSKEKYDCYTLLCREFNGYIQVARFNAFDGRRVLDALTLILDVKESDGFVRGHNAAEEEGKND